MEKSISCAHKDPCIAVTENINAGPPPELAGHIDQCVFLQSVLKHSTDPGLAKLIEHVHPPLWHTRRHCLKPTCVQPQSYAGLHSGHHKNQSCVGDPTSTTELITFMDERWTP
jgi:hypothetical protein